MATCKLLSTALQVMITATAISAALMLVGVGVLVVLHACTVAKAFQRRFITVSSTERLSSPLDRGLSPSDLNRMPSYEYEMAGGERSGAVDCAVCLESFQAGDVCRRLPVCKHSFHARCVDSWLLIAPVCPICRTGVGRGTGKGAAVAAAAAAGEFW